jgi:hypothetical protein
MHLKIQTKHLLNISHKYNHQNQLLQLKVILIPILILLLLLLLLLIIIIQPYLIFGSIFRMYRKHRKVYYNTQRTKAYIQNLNESKQDQLDATDSAARTTSSPQCTQLTPYSPRLQPAIASAENHTQ